MELLKDDSIYKEEIVDAQLEHSEEFVQSNLPITENEISMISNKARYHLLINEANPLASAAKSGPKIMEQMHIQFREMKRVLCQENTEKDVDDEKRQKSRKT